MNLMNEPELQRLDLSLDQQQRLSFEEKPAHWNATTWKREELL